MPKLRMCAGAEAIKMATEDRFDVSEWFKMMKVREIACRSNNPLLTNIRPIRPSGDKSSTSRSDVSTSSKLKSASKIPRLAPMASITKKGIKFYS